MNYQEADNLFNQAYQLVESGHTRQARDILENIVRFIPDHLEALILLGYISPPGEAKVYFEHVLSLEPGNIEARQGLLQVEQTSQRRLMSTLIFGIPVLIVLAGLFVLAGVNLWDTVDGDATPTVIAGHTQTATATLTATATKTVTSTATASITPTRLTSTPLDTLQPTPRQFLPASRTPTEMAQEPTAEPTADASATPSPTPSVTPTITLTETLDGSLTATVTGTLTITTTLDSDNGSPTVTHTPTDTLTITETITGTLTETLTPTDTLTPSETFTPSDTPTGTLTITVTDSETPTFTPTNTLTPSDTPTFTPSATTAEPTIITEKGSPTDTPTFTDTPTATDTPTPTATRTPTDTLTPSETFTPSDTPTPTNTPTDTPTFTRTYTPTDTLTPTNVPPDYIVYDHSLEMVTLVNQARCAAGLNPVTVNPLLNNAGTIHSVDMAVNNFFDHTGSDGSDVGTRVTDQGYPWIFVGENIAGGQTSVGQAFNTWMGSDAHRANILNPDFREMGLGHVYRDASDLNHYWTQVFASRGTEPITCEDVGL